MNWLFYAFLAVWAIHLFYLLSISNRQQRLHGEIERLRAMLEARIESAAGKS